MNNKDDELMKRPRGKPQQYTDDQLMQIALDIKYKIGGAKLSYSLLEQNTGISRNTFMRRIGKYIDDINSPITREIGVTEKDSVYYPNFGFIYETYRNNPKRMLAELQNLEVIFQKTIESYNDVKKQLTELQSMKKQYNDLLEKSKHYQNQAIFYKNLYETYIVSSMFAHKRQELGLEKKMLDFKEYASKNGSINSLHKLFPESKTTEGGSENDSKAKEKLKAKYPNLFEPDHVND
ncbi:hypothetical protein [Paenibacillus cymbidii]|uniref:hypothetical protein n=1 Tax=Paenibacillus cymbidii TaxID=1639034 RepID=UPI001080D482|nr:hypothetical protein [Paenibacillus cymbidii]